MSSSARTSSSLPGPETCTRTSSPGCSPASRRASTGNVTWFLREITLIPFTIARKSKGVLVVAAALLAPGSAGASTLRGNVIRVPQDAPTVQAAVDAAAPGDGVLVDRGTYPGGVVVLASKPNITIRGVDRNAVVFDGGDTQDDAIDVHADGVTLQNLTAHNFLKNAFYWEGVKGFTGSYLTVWNVLGYGIYAEGSTDGLIEHDYVSGAADAPYYIVHCNPCRSTIRRVVARLSAVGYSGTNASGRLVIRDSTWDRNG